MIKCYYNRKYKKKDTKKNILNVKRTINLDVFDNDQITINRKDRAVILKNIKSDYLNEIQALIYSIDNLTTQLLMLRKQKEECYKKMEQERTNYIEKIKREINPDFLCNICFDNRVDLVLVPCGHTICSKCYRSPNCFVCRNPVQKPYKIFFS